MDLESVRIFVKVVQHGGFSKAAAALKIPTSTISRTISRLETEVGAKLLSRTTRSISLTPAGQALFDRTVAPTLALEDALKSVEGTDAAVTGAVRITATEDLGALVVTPIVGRLAKLYPRLSFELVFTNEVVDLVKGGFDLALRAGRLNPSRFKAIRVGEVAFVAVASPSYLASHPKIEAPEDLSGHDCLIFSSEAARARWALSSKKRSVKVALSPRMVANQMHSLVTLAVAGAGIALVPAHAAARELVGGTLTRVLPDWSGSTFDLHLVSPNVAGLPARTRLVANEIVNALRPLLATANPR